MLEQVFQLSSATLTLHMIYLDPNNPRFADNEGIRISDEEIDNEVFQKELMAKMEREHAVDRLKDSMESNGYLPIDRIIIRQFKKDKYVVLEGNRRITAAKRLLELDQSKKIELDSRISQTLKEVPVLIYTGEDPDAAWIFQGIRHISGVRDWSAYHKAKLLVTQMEENNLNLTEAGKIFGISAFSAGQWVRGYYTYQQIKDHPDYHRDADAKIFPYFQELFGRSNISLRDWLDWDEKKRKFQNADRFDEFMSWFYPKLNDQGEFDPDLPGNWEKRRIPRTLDLRNISELLSKYPDEFRSFRNGTQLNLAIGRAVAKEEELSENSEDYARWLEKILRELERFPILRIINEDKQSLIYEKIINIKKMAEKFEPLLKHE
ncbi:MAG: ParB N-terminal domain-containing protein [Desulfobacterales bacterium]|nr:ParB N-terminal domain-containing protein [Desulfobacterales bacterium]